MTTWEQFVALNGWRAPVHHLAMVVGQPEKTINRARAVNGLVRLEKAKTFPELFALWNGRPPEDHEWPKPKKSYAGAYEWQQREISLLVSLVGHMGTDQIAELLTQRLRKVTGDRRATRSRVSIKARIAQIGLQTSDVVGGITTKQAIREIGSVARVYHAIRNKQLKAVRRGRYWVVPYDAWDAYKAERVFPPKGWIRLASIKEKLSITSYKLSEWARMGYVPGCIRASSLKGPGTQFGTWYIDPKVARKLIADRRAGRPMPWHGKPEPGNLRITWKLWQERKHPETCSNCRKIWGKQGAPETYDDYMLRYPPLEHGAKRHLTKKWAPGYTLKELSKFTGRTMHQIRMAISNGMLDEPQIHGRAKYVSRSAAQYWKAVHCPTGIRERTYISLQTARKDYGFKQQELRALIKSGKLKTRIATGQERRGQVLVSRGQCRRLREETGFDEKYVARKLGVTKAKLQILLKGVKWREADGITLHDIRTMTQRMQSQHGYTVQQAAAKIKMPVSWVIERIQDGTIRVQRPKWDRRRRYITEPMFLRLEKAKRKPKREQLPEGKWLMLQDAAFDAGVSSSQLIRWADDGEVTRKRNGRFFWYLKKSVRSRARRYWRTENRFHRATPPAWLKKQGRSEK